MKLPKAKKLLGSLILCGVAGGNVLNSTKNSIMADINSWASDLLSPLIEVGTSRSIVLGGLSISELTP